MKCNVCDYEIVDGEVTQHSGFNEDNSPEEFILVESTTQSLSGKDIIACPKCGVVKMAI